MDRYDVESMIRDALLRHSSDWQRAIDMAVSDLRSEIGSERVDRRDAIESLQRVLNSRTEHLV
jgi:hypothetical protein